jgi:hypothetical protein
VHQFDTVDRTIRNQRCRPSLGLLWLLTWSVSWAGVAMILDVETPHEWRVPTWIAAFVLIFASWILLILVIMRRPVSRLRLGSELQIRPIGSLKSKDIEAIRFAGDPDEDYVERKLPIPLCQLTIEPRKRRSIQLIVSLGDAARVREWAEHAGIVVIDPEGFSRGINMLGATNE